MKYSESQIKSIGGNRFLKKRAKRITILYILSFAWIPLVYTMINKPSILIVIAPLALVTINLVMGYMQSRKLYYNKIKNNPELLE